MAYNNYFPQYFGQPVPMQIPQQQQTPLQAPQMPSQAQGNIQTTNIPSNGFVTVRSEAEARNYPVALGNSVTFRDENLPYIYTKTMGFSQMERPVFDKYKLVKEDSQETPVLDEEKHECQSREDAEKLKSEIECLKDEIDKLKSEVDDLRGDMEKAGIEITVLKKKVAVGKKVVE